MAQTHLLLLLVSAHLIGLCLAFQGGSFRASPTTRTLTHLSATSQAKSTKTTLTEDTTWLLRLSLSGLKSAKGYRVEDELVALPVQFVEDEGYEPPQGRLQVISAKTSDPTASGSEQASRWRFFNTYWKLSEDPNERKDGLWVWGLFKEPLYPFLLLQLETYETPLMLTTTTSKDPTSCTDCIPALQLYAQINHKRDSDVGVRLDGSFPLLLRQTETIKADPFGAATANVYNNVQVGTIRIEPMVER